VIYGLVELIHFTTHLLRVERTEVEHRRIVNKRNCHVVTFQMSDSGHCEVVELLLSRGAYVDPFSTDHGTPLHVAAMHKQDGAMKILLDHHADVSSIYVSL
jgi:ankyrin repeat protein